MQHGVINGSSSGGLATAVPDISIRNHKRWKTAYEKLLGDYLIRGHQGADELATLVRGVLSRILEKDLQAHTFKCFQVVSDIIDVLSRGSLSSPRAFSK
jgi:hypothetical protein